MGDSITNAINILTRFYKGSGMIEKASWENLLQRRSDPIVVPSARPPLEEPATWTVHPYTGVMDPTNEGHGVIAVLESLNAQFMEMEAKYKQAEETNQAEFDAQLTDLTTLKSDLVQEIKNFVAEIERLQGRSTRPRRSISVNLRSSSPLSTTCWRHCQVSVEVVSILPPRNRPHLAWLTTMRRRTTTTLSM